MKILLVGPKWIGGWVDGVKRAINALGYKSMLFYYDTPFAPNSYRMKTWISQFPISRLRGHLTPVAKRLGHNWEDYMNRRLILIGRNYNPDVILLLKGETVQSETLFALQKNGRLIFSWWIDDPILNFQQYPEIAKQFEFLDTLFVFDKGRFSELSAFGARNLKYLPCAVDPHVYNSRNVSAKEQRKFQSELAMVASYYPKRGELVKHMRGFDLAIWGVGWKNAEELREFSSGTLRGTELTGSEASIVYKTASICPNIHHPQSKVGGMNMRTFEIPASGGFELVDHILGIEEFFEVGRDVIVYESFEHFRDLISYYLLNPTRRNKIISRGRDKVLKYHTYIQRLKMIFETARYMR